MNIIEKYEKILQKPQPEPFKEYLEELLAALKEKGENAKPKKIMGGKVVETQLHGEYEVHKVLL